MPRIVSILFGATFTVVVMWALGRLLFARLRIRLRSTEHDLLAFVAGGAILSILVFILCSIDAARTWVFLVLGTAALVLNWRFGASSDGTSKALPASWKLLFTVPFIIYALLYISNSLAPEISADGQAYHLGLVYRFFREHGFHRLTTNMYSNMPLGVEMLFLFAFSFGRHSAAATVHCCYLLSLPLLILSYTRRIGKPRAGVCAALLVCLAPAAGIFGISAYNDVALAATAFALFCLLDIWRGEAETDARLLIPIGLLAGFCVAIKLTGFAAPLYAAAVILLQKKPKALAPVAAAAAVLILPWLIKDWVWLGNPVSPFFNRIFPNPFIHVQFEDDYRAYFRHYDMTSFRPWFRMVTTSGIPGSGDQIGPWFLLSPLALLSLRSDHGRRSLLAAAFFLVPYPLNIAARFLIPALPFLALALAVALEFSPAALVVLTASAVVLGWPSVVRRYASNGGFHIQQFEWRAALRITPQDQFLREHSPGWVAAQTLDYFVPKGKRVWSSAPIAEAYCSTDVMIGFQSAEGESIQDILTTAVFDKQMPTQNFRFIFPRQRVRHVRIAQTADANDIWSIGELQLFNGAQQISPASSWRLDATPFPWDIAFAFDNNPVTRWKSWESIHPGMHVDVDFGSPRELDRIELHSSHDQAKIEIHPESCDGAACRPIPAKLEKLDDPPLSDLRRLAAQTVKARGIDYLLIDDSYPIAADVSGDPARWGMDLIAKRGAYTIYRIQ